MASTVAIERDLTYSLDRVAFAEDTLAVALDSWQAGLLESDSPRILLNACRQSGKSTITAALAVWEAVYVPKSLILMLSPSQRQSRELFAKAMAVYRAIGVAVPSEVENRLELELTNGSRIVSLPGKEQTIRGYSGARLILIDEASRVPDELYRAVRPMLAVSGGRLIALSTPFGKRGWWYEAWEDGGPVWERVFLTADQCPRISPDFLDEERRELGPLWFRSEYLCEFVDVDDAVFRTDDIDRALRSDIEPLFAVAGD